jgi:hypothetical protein
MKKYLVLYRAPASSRAQMASATPEQSKAATDAWMGWAKRTGSALVELGAPLGQGGSLNGKPASDDVGGYSIVQAASLDAAKGLFDGHPHLKTPGGGIEVFEFVAITGM